MKRNFTNKLVKWSQNSNRKPLMVYGARQIGKTYCIVDFCKKNFKRHIYINFEKDREAYKFFENNLDPKTIIQKIQSRLEIDFDPKKDILFLDEIQECPLAITSLKYFCEEMQELRVVAAGSLLGVKVGEASYPVGKVDILEMQPMSFEEFLGACAHHNLISGFKNFSIGEETSTVLHEKLWEYFKYYLIVGGMPEVVKAFAENKSDLNLAIQKSSEIQEKIISIYLSDIAKHCGKINAMHLQRLLENIPQQLAREADQTSSRFRFKGIIPGKSKFAELVDAIDWLEAAGLVNKIYIVDTVAEPLSAYKKENIFKLYIFDTGLLRALSNISVDSILNYNFGTFKGYLVENFVLQELICMTSLREKIFAWKENTAEIEFIKKINNNLVPIEVKSGNKTASKSLASYYQRYQPQKMIIFSGQKPKIDENLYKLPLYFVNKISQL
jgi:predicted AAA+ superfamily ATPase